MESYNIGGGVSKAGSFEIVEEPIKREVRPLCPECGSKHIWSRGSRWVCAECGRYFTKMPRSKKIDFKERPCCPECGAYHTTSFGKDWQCGACGRFWKKVYKRPLAL